MDSAQQHSDHSKMVMVLGGFGCSRNALIALNVLYICVAFILIGVAGYGITASSITNFGVIIAIVMVSILLMIIAIIGIVAAMKHHQVMLFFYMVILFLLFIVQFSVACACLAVGDEQIRTLMEQGWRLSKNDTRQSVQDYWDCCGFYGHTFSPLQVSANLTERNVFTLNSHPTCSELRCCADVKMDKLQTCCDPSIPNSCPCHPCFSTLEEVVKASLRLCGGIGLFFSFTELVGVFLTIRYRDQRNPYIDPSDIF